MSDDPATHRTRPEGSVAEEFLHGCRRAVESLAAAADDLEARAPDGTVAEDVVRRGFYRPAEEAALVAWFARFLTIRNGLWEVLRDVSGPVGGSVRRVLNTFEWRCFVLGYTSACLIVQIDRLLLESVARDSVTQRKLNEGSDFYRIPRKQYTGVLESFTDPGKAHRMDQAMRFAGRHREILDALTEDPVVGSIAVHIPVRERVLEPSRRRYFSRLATYLSHAFKRRGASARQQALFAALEAGGRLASEVRDPWTPDRIDDGLRAEVEAVLRPGDVLVTRHDRAFTNLFLPGFWPHAALYIGTEDDRRRLEIDVDADRASRWHRDCSVLEAFKDGVLFRSLEETLAVDAVAVIRPRLDESEIARGLARAVLHEGKGYDFDFDFFRSDRLVCTEVVYRAYDGLGTLHIPLRERSGRPTVSAEDLLGLAVDGDGFEPVAVVGAPTCPDRLARGAEATEVLRETCRSVAPAGSDRMEPTRKP